MFHRHYLFLKSGANRFRTGAGYFRIRVQTGLEPEQDIFEFGCKPV